MTCTRHYGLFSLGLPVGIFIQFAHLRSSLYFLIYLYIFCPLQCSTFAALRGGSAVRCCGRLGRRRAQARGGTGQQAFVAPLPVVSDGFNFSRTPFGDSTLHISTLAGLEGYADFSSRHRQANFGRKHVISSGTEDFVSFRQPR